MRELKPWTPWIIGAAVLLVLYLNELEQTAGAGSSEDHPMQGFTKQTFVAKLQPIANQVEQETGIKAVLGIAQAAHESAWGNSLLANGQLEDGATGQPRYANNLFGFTADVGTYWRSQGQPFVNAVTHEWVDQLGPGMTLVKQDPSGKLYVEMRRPFRAYDGWEQSYRDWARLMQTKHYVDAGVLDALRSGDLQAWSAAIDRAKYATDPRYGSEVAGVGAVVANLV